MVKLHDAPGAPGPPTTKILQRPRITRVEKKGVSIGGKPVPGLRKLGRRLFQNLSIYIFIFFLSSKIILNENNHCIRRLGSLSKMTQRAQFRLVLGLCKVLTQTRQQQALRVFRLASEIWVKPNVSVELPAQNRSSQKW